MRGPSVIGLKASSGLGLLVLTSFSSNFGKGKRTERGGGARPENGILAPSSSFLTGSLGKPAPAEGGGACMRGGIPCKLGSVMRGMPPNAAGGRWDKLGKEEEGGMSSFGRPGRPMGGLVPGGITGSMPAIGFRVSGGGSPEKHELIIKRL